MYSLSQWPYHRTFWLRTDETSSPFGVLTTAEGLLLTKTDEMYSLPLETIRENHLAIDKNRRNVLFPSGLSKTRLVLDGIDNFGCCLANPIKSVEYCFWVIVLPRCKVKRGPARIETEVPADDVCDRFSLDFSR